MPTVLITEPIAESAVEVLKQKGFHVQFEYEKRNSDHAPEDVTAVINRLHPISDEWMAQYPNLKIIAYHGVGYDGIDTEAAKARGICVAITPGQNALGVAEHTMTLIMALSKQLVAVASDYKKDGFSCKYAHSYSEVADKTLGLIGLGNIGLRVANMARNGFAMHVIAYDPFLKTAPNGIELVQDRTEIFREADFISPHLNLTDDTFHSIGETEFKAMKPTACIINVSRGAIIDEPALVRALQENEIGGAGLDVTDPEECALSNPLLHMSNVIVTPHIAGSSKEALERVATMCIANIECYFAGKELPGRKIV